MKRTHRILLLAFAALSLMATACSEETTTTLPDNENQEQPDTDNPNDDNGNDNGDTSEKIENLLTGKVIGTARSVDYSTGQASTTVNSRENVFDGDFTTYFASYDRSGTWVGLDLQTKHVITKIGYSPRIDQSSRVVLAILEGANNADFSDAIPIYIIKEAAPEREMTYAEINCSRGFRYVRYVTPNDVRCNLAELAFYGIEDEGDDSQLYQLTNLPTVVINTQLWAGYCFKGGRNQEYRIYNFRKRNETFVRHRHRSQRSRKCLMGFSQEALSTEIQREAFAT